MDSLLVQRAWKRTARTFVTQNRSVW
jgi:hypothetical protein